MWGSFGEDDVDALDEIRCAEKLDLPSPLALESVVEVPLDAVVHERLSDRTSVLHSARKNSCSAMDQPFTLQLTQTNATSTRSLESGLESQRTSCMRP